jgi:hypothetical protein
MPNLWEAVALHHLFFLSVAPEIDGLNKVGSIWISVARLGVANLEGKGESENELFATYCTVGHNYLQFLKILISIWSSGA